MQNTMSKFQYTLLIGAFSFYAAITLFGFNALYESPYTGLRLTPWREKILVEGVDSGSPADISGVRFGDRLITVNGDEIPPIVFFEEPDHLRWKKDRSVFRHWRERFDETIDKGRFLTLGIQRAGEHITVSFIPTQFPFSRALLRTLPAYAVAWASTVLALIVLRKKQDEVARLNVMMWYVTGIVGITLTPYTVRDIAFPTDAMLTLSRINRLAMFFSVFAWINFILVFPRRRKVLDVYPGIGVGLYAAAVLLTLLDLAGAFDDTFVLSYSAVGGGGAIIAFRLIYDLVKERDSSSEKQIQWVVFGIAGGDLVQSLDSALYPASAGFAVP